MSIYQLKYLEYKTKYLMSKMQKGGNSGYDPDKSNVINIDRETVSNKDYRRVIYTSDYSQLVLMCLKPGVEIGMELHADADQFIRVEKGFAYYGKNGNRTNYIPSSSDNHTTIYDNNMQPTGTIINNEIGKLPQDHVFLVPRNTWHNVWNPKDSKEDVHIYTLYSFGKQNSPHKKNMVVEHQKSDEKYEEH